MWYVLASRSAVQVSVYDAMGRRVRVLVDAQQSAGRHEVVFDASGLPSGVYFYRLEAGAFRDMRQMHLLR